MTDAERLARAYLLRVAEPPALALHRFVAEHGPVEAADRVREAAVPESVAAETAARRDLDRAEHDLESAAEHGARLVIPEDDEWPAWPLLSLEVASGRGVKGMAPPLALWVRGSASLDDALDSAVAIVGARAATDYGENTAAEFAYELTDAGMTVVSGAAYGIDGAAHRGSLAADGVTVAVLGCGLDVGYPAGHVRLLDRVAQCGAVVSEYPPGTQPARHRFLVRNRLIAALSAGTVVVEAGCRSGAQNTAATAGTLGKVVMAVPGPVGSALSVGCHRLIRRSHAVLVDSVADIVESVGSVGSGLADHGDGPRRHTDGLDPEALRVFEALPSRGGRSPEAVAMESGVELSRVRALLPALELDGLVQRSDNGWRRRPRRITGPTRG
ncbi:DNA-processing protein DprA [Saccharomonospora sp.]|uniref:DNA-processing protein DprA n=1 Tax=Saccharomonospora sp. TaxID=33913 RepID=UPI002638B29F|nr:DNA-processing protein DprA [Saccharomonospora sp.]